MYESVDMMVKLFVGMELNFEGFEDYMFKTIVDLCLFLIKEPSNRLNKRFQYEIIVLVKKSFIEMDPVHAFQLLLSPDEGAQLHPGGRPHQTRTTPPTRPTRSSST